MPNNSPKRFVLVDLQGRLLSLNPANNQFAPVRKYAELKIWDVLPDNEENTWFMGNNPKPKSGYVIKEVPRKHLGKFS